MVIQFLNECNVTYCNRVLQIGQKINSGKITTFNIAETEIKKQQNCISIVQYHIKTSIERYEDI